MAPPTETATPPLAGADKARAYLDDLGIPTEELGDWKLEVATRAGRDVAVVATSGTEIHFVSLDEGRAMSRRNTLAFLEPIFTEHGLVTTRVPIAETDHKLRERLGFTETWADENFRYFAMTALPFQRK